MRGRPHVTSFEVFNEKFQSFRVPRDVDFSKRRMRWKFERYFKRRAIVTLTGGKNFLRSKLAFVVDSINFESEMLEITTRTF